MTSGNRGRFVQQKALDGLTSLALLVISLAQLNIKPTPIPAVLDSGNTQRNQSNSPILWPDDVQIRHLFPQALTLSPIPHRFCHHRAGTVDEKIISMAYVALGIRMQDSRFGVAPPAWGAMIFAVNHFASFSCLSGRSVAPASGTLDWIGDTGKYPSGSPSRHAVLMTCVGILGFEFVAGSTPNALLNLPSAAHPQLRPSSRRGSRFSSAGQVSPSAVPSPPTRVPSSKGTGI
ncbi:hypothetical protein BKA70DRAFT_1419446 [Coprinopsis sp. MPI-PUGE-AT-0042]|nr:hypothetical protein BKA70DRAFT_1419446 [Coprinopsis sp. MPI-PUGE-AT-0042]